MMRAASRLIVAGLVSFIIAAPSGAQVMITEIMYNPASKEARGETEWVEIANVGKEIVEIKGWRLDDEDNGDWGTFDCALQPGAVAVIVNSAAVTEEKFRAAWDAEASLGAAPAYAVIPVTWGSLGNNPAADNETLRLLNDKSEVICEVNLQSGGAWPEITNEDGCSVWLTDLRAPDLGSGKFWRKSVAGEQGARACTPNEAFDKADIGSPGYVPGLGDAPAPKPAEPNTPEDEKPKDQKSGSGRIDF
jgi:hypothetical protein